MIDPTTNVTIVLQAQEWNAVLETLAGAPWRVAQPLIVKLSQQLTATAAPQVPQMAKGMRLVGDEPPSAGGSGAAG